MEGGTLELGLGLRCLSFVCLHEHMMGAFGWLAFVCIAMVFGYQVRSTGAGHSIHKVRSLAQTRILCGNSPRTFVILIKLQAAMDVLERPESPNLKG